MWSSSEESSNSRLIDFVSLKSNKKEEKVSAGFMKGLNKLSDALDGGKDKDQVSPVYGLQFQQTG